MSPGYAGIEYFTSQIAVGGYTAATFGPVAAKFTAYVASTIGNGANVTIVSGGITDTPASLFIGRRRSLLQSQQTYASVQYQVGILAAYAANARSFMSSLGGASAANALSNAGLTKATSVELLSAPTLSGLTAQTVYVYTSSPSSSSSGCLGLSSKAGCSGAIAGIVIGAVLAACCCLIILYFTIFKKKNIETGQKSIVLMTSQSANPVAVSSDKV